jgi:hypothetical protein
MMTAATTSAAITASVMRTSAIRVRVMLLGI